MDLDRVLGRVLNEEMPFFGADKPSEIYGTPSDPTPQGMLHDPSSTSWPDSSSKPGRILDSMMLEVNILKLLDSFIGSDIERKKIYLFFGEFGKKEKIEELGTRIRDNIRADVRLYPTDDGGLSKWVLEVGLEKLFDDEDEYGELDARMKGQSKEIGSPLELSGAVDVQ